MPKSKSRAVTICIVVASDSQMFNPLGATPLFRVALHTDEDRKNLDEYLLSRESRGYDEEYYGRFFWGRRKKPREISLDTFIRRMKNGDQC